MRDLAMQAAGGLAILAATLHGILGETKVFARAHIEPARTRMLLRLVWQCGTVAWIGIGALLAAAPVFGMTEMRAWIAVTAIVTFGLAAAANAWATKGRHFGWMMFAAVVTLTLTGY